MKRSRSPSRSGSAHRERSLASCPLVPERLRGALAAARLKTCEEFLALDAGQLEERAKLSQADAKVVAGAITAWYGGHSTNLLCAITEMGPRAIDTGQAE